jgi:hypothetical protein
MDSGSSDVGEGGRGIGIISGLSTRGSGKVEVVHLVLSSLPSRLMMICKVR